ncbi:hypothetical protein GCM10010259_50240 [Streptomyces daghestanicus]|uniref:Uncharacterized protein n=1 Tax=Streptomyces daghestanicus TaxID=66885 RepID=A0ABQ3PVX3_9ACTN|nr:hypothetical protein GCM10010240_48570 [Streptomyces griseoviridis]GGU52898.1 hypothetical protein GCM10010259_50240 [Streptomyces daghestanicus]GHI29163.1 hypothetical protein Sdagh_08930 [Streptomyces daghestanicus]
MRTALREPPGVAPDRTDDGNGAPPSPLREAVRAGERPPGQTTPLRIAYATACVRLRRPNRVMTSCSTFLMVRSE